MQLHYAPISPFARKVRVMIREKALLGRIEEINLNPLNDPPELLAANPLGKIPALVLADGCALFDSPVICEYLDTISGAPRYVPKEGERRWQVLRLQALADGIMDAAVAIVYENRRPEAQRSSEWQQRRLSAIFRAIASLETNPVLAGPAHLGSIAVGCALGYIDFRLPEYNWRLDHPRLHAAYVALSELPGMQATVPVLPT